MAINVEWFRLQKQWHNLSLRSQDSIGVYWITCVMKSISRRTENLSQRLKWVTAIPFFSTTCRSSLFEKITIAIMQWSNEQLEANKINLLIAITFVSWFFFIKYGLNKLQIEISKRKRKYLVSKLYVYDAMKWK